MNKGGFTPLEKNPSHLRQGEKNKFDQDLKPGQNFQTGFTLIELMIVVAIIGILAAIAVPNFISYRNKSRIASCISTLEGVRAAQAGFASNSMMNDYPTQADVHNNWEGFRAVMRANGLNLKGSAQGNGFQSQFTYQTYDIGVMGEANNYYFIFRVQGVPTDLTGCQIEVRPAMIERQTY